MNNLFHLYKTLYFQSSIFRTSLEPHKNPMRCMWPIPEIKELKKDRFLLIGTPQPANLREKTIYINALQRENISTILPRPTAVPPPSVLPHSSPACVC